MNVRDQTIEFEGWCNRAYADPLTHGEPFTVGVGATGAGIGPTTYWTDDQINARLSNDLAHASSQVHAALPWFSGLNEPRQAVLIGMCFQMGLGGLVAFHHMLTAAAQGRFAAAAQEMLASKWATQTPGRARILARQMSTGSWPDVR